jgi:plasmid stabilization system protein ParE
VARVLLSRCALGNLRPVLDDLETRAGARIAQQFAVAFDAAIEGIGDLAGQGAPRPQFAASTRVALVPPCTLYYDGGPDSATVLVVRIVHGHRKVTTGLIEEGRS